MPEELLPCPFCGGPATGPELADSTWWIECERCEFTIERNSKVWTIDTWNKREVNTQQEEVEPSAVTRAREILEECGIVDVQGTPADQLRPLVEVIERNLDLEKLCGLRVQAPDGVLTYNLGCFAFRIRPEAKDGDVFELLRVPK